MRLQALLVPLAVAALTLGVGSPGTELEFAL